jgi:hypothetical protein
VRLGRSEHLGTYRKVKGVGVAIGGHVRRLYSLREECRCTTEDLTPQPEP